LKMLPVGGIDLAVWDWPGRDPALIFAHATGFHGRCWDQIARMFPGRRRLAVDFRGHGRSSKPEPPYLWPAFGSDLAAVAEQLGVAGAIGVGHSIVAAALVRPEMFGAMVLVDPTIFPPEYYRGTPLDASFILRRRNSWASAEEMVERFRSRPPFATWQPEVLRDYCDFALRREGDGFVLACPPLVERSIYEQSIAPESYLYDEIPRLTQPVTVMRAAVLARAGVLELSASPTAPDLASRFQQGRDVYLADRNHFIPMEWPEGVANEIARMEHA